MGDSPDIFSDEPPDPAEMPGLGLDEPPQPIAAQGIVPVVIQLRRVLPDC